MLDWEEDWEEAWEEDWKEAWEEVKVTGRLEKDQGHPTPKTLTLLLHGDYCRAVPKRSDEDHEMWLKAQKTLVGGP